MKKELLAVAVAVAGSLGATGLHAALAPYSSADTNTLHLYKFSETDGTQNLADLGSLAYPMTNTGGVNGRDNIAGNGGGYAAAGYVGTGGATPFGTAFSTVKAGDGTYHQTSSGNATGGGVGGTGSTNLWDTTTGAFTWEALVRNDAITKTGTPTAEWVIISQDGDPTRGAMFRITNGNLSVYYRTTTPTSLTAAIPTAAGDPDHFVANEWFHAAVTYNGNAGEADNLKFYWTRVTETATEANLIGTATLAADISLTTGNAVWLGGASRFTGRFEMASIDEVRISNVARGAGDFVFVPEPTSMAVIGLAGFALLSRRKKD